MQISIKVDTSKAKALATQFPRAADLAARNFVERVGFTIEREAKKAAPAITGNLRRSIFFVKDSPQGGARVFAYANYAEYVHGQPFYQNQMRRKETPFFTYAVMNSASKINQYQRDIIKDIAANIGK